LKSAAILKEQATKAQAYAINIFKSLTALEKYLDPEQRIQTSEDHNSKWPELDKLRTRALRSTAPPFDRLKKPTTTNDLTTVGTSTSPLLEKVVVTGEPAFSSSNDINAVMDTNNVEIDPTNNTGASSSTSSLALSRLRGLSSRSIRAMDSSNEV
jgi:hypothetical protein